MAFTSKFTFAPAEWLPFRDTEVLDRAAMADIREYQGKIFENPQFEMKVVGDVHNFFTIDLFQRMRMSDVKNEKVVLVLPSPENAVFVNVAELINRHNVSCRNVHIFFLFEFANEKGEVAPWQSPFSRSGHFMRHFYQRVRESLRMPMENIHFWTKENVNTYSDELASLGGADMAYTTLSWAGGIGAIDAETFPAKTMDELVAMGSRLVTLCPEMSAHESLRGMFGYSGDIASVPPCAATLGPKNLAAAKDRMHLQYLTACGGFPAHQKFPLKLALVGPVCPTNPAAMMRLMSGICYVSNDVAAPVPYEEDVDWLVDTINEIREKEEA